MPASFWQKMFPEKFVVKSVRWNLKKTLWWERLLERFGKASLNLSAADRAGKRVH